LRRRKTGTTSSSDSFAIITTRIDQEKYYKEWESAKTEFAQLYEDYRRISAEDRRDFILLHSLEQHLKRENVQAEGKAPPMWKNNFERLYKAPFFASSSEPPYISTAELQPHTALYFTLFALGTPHLLTDFRR